jgi:hypothetical protein
VKSAINPRTAALDPVKMLEETGTKVSISTVKRVLYRQGRSHCSKSAIKKKTDWFVTAHGDTDCTFWKNVLWSDETKI